MNDYKFSIKNMDLFYGDFQALKDINIDLNKEGITALIGPSRMRQINISKIPEQDE